MPDVFTQPKRSEVMSRIRGSGNRDTELRLIALFRANRIKAWRRNAAVFGKPDFVFRRERVAVFVDGCFWHRHRGCKFSYMPKSRTEFWLSKFERNVARDRVVTRTLRKAGWKVIRVWECQLVRNKAKRTIARIDRALRVMLSISKTRPKPH
jgi:DNA mismatch endonuclease (patch repair protein)